MENTTDEEMQKDFESSGSIYPKVEFSHIQTLMEKVKYDAHIVDGTTTTVITAFIPIGNIKFTLCTEIMACVDPRNFNKEKGEKYGIEKAAKSAQDKLWELEGYSLARKMFSDDNNKNSTPKQRVEVETKDLQEKVDALAVFVSKGKPSFIDTEHWELLKNQLISMREYLSILNFRLKIMG